MNTDLFQQAIEQLHSKQQFRSLANIHTQGQSITLPNHPTPLINISSNDYLAIGSDSDLQDEFFNYIHQLPPNQRPPLGSTSSRLLTGNHQQLQQLEDNLTNHYQQANSNSTPLSALIINSGYHANMGILPALAVLPQQKGQTLILADKLVHASLIDGIRLANLNRNCHYHRYRHNDYQHLRQLINHYDNGKKIISRIIIVTESVFSMDGDLADLAELVAIKKADPRVELYLDEAHAVGVFGEMGLGVAEETGTIGEIDYLVGTFGKAFASMGAFIICHSSVRQWLINSMRTLIYSTALPPIIHSWNNFILQKMPLFTKKRQYLQQISQQVKQTVEEITQAKNIVGEMTKCYKENERRCISNTSSEFDTVAQSQFVHYPAQSPIIPYIIGNNENTLNKAQQLQNNGFYALAIRPPTVPNNSARLRLVMNAGLDEEVINKLIKLLLKELKLRT